MKKKLIFYIFIFGCFIFAAPSVHATNTSEEDLSIYRTAENKIAGELYLNPKWIEWNNLSEEEKAEWEVIPNKLIRDYVYEKEDNIIQPFSEIPDLKPIYESLPSSYNLRDDGYVSPIKNQGTLGLCWSFATIGAIESTALKTLNKSLIFSERQVDYALSNPETSITEGYNPYGSEWRTLGEGGNFSDFNQLFVSGISPQLTSVWGSYSTTTSTKNISKVIDDSLVSYSITGTKTFPYLNVTTATEEEKEAYREIIKKHITTYGGVYVSTIVPDSRSGSCYNSSYNMIYQTEDCTFSDENPYHALLIIGWNDTYGPDYDGDGVGDGAWILKNSWGTSDHPYPYLSYNSIDVGYEAVSSIESKDYNNVYDFTDRHYIERISTTYGNYITKVTIYNSKEVSETLTRIMFNSYYTGDVKFYLENNDGSELFLGEYAREDTDGIRSINLNNIQLPLDKFVIRIESEDYFYMDYYGFYTNRNVDSTTKTVETRFDFNNYLIDITSSSSSYFTIHSITNNIKSGEKLEYKVYNENNEDISSLFTLETDNNYIINNSAQTEMWFKKSDLNFGNYRIDTYYNNSKIDEYTFSVSPIKVKELTINTLNIKSYGYIGATYQLKTTINPSNAYNRVLEYESSNPEVATIDETGKITALSKGVTTITVSATDGSNVSSSVTYEVFGNRVTSINFAESSYELYTKDTLTLNPTILPEDAYNKKIRYSSSDKNIATVDENGIVKGLKSGTVTITATADDGSMKQTSVKVTIRESVTKINVEKDNYETLTGHTLDLYNEVNVEPSTSYNKKLLWESSDENIATVSSGGYISIKKVGTVTITISTTDGSNLSKDIIINVLGEGIKTINDNGLEFNVFVNGKRSIHEKISLTPINTTTGIYDDTLLYSSVDESIATVDENGIVTGISEGTTYIKVSSIYPEKWDSYIVKVFPKLDGEGTDENPYKIYNQYDFDKLRVDPNATYSLENDIVFSDEDYAEDGNFYNNGKYWKSIQKFNGKLIGNEHSISNIKSGKDTATRDSNYGTIFKTLENATIKDLVISNAVMQSYFDEGIFANASNYSTFDNIKVLDSEITTDGDASLFLRYAYNNTISNLLINNSIMKNGSSTSDYGSGVIGYGGNNLLIGIGFNGSLSSSCKRCGTMLAYTFTNPIFDSYVNITGNKGTDQYLFGYNYGGLLYNSYAIYDGYNWDMFNKYDENTMHNYYLYNTLDLNTDAGIINTLQGVNDENGNLNFCSKNNCSDNNIWSLKDGDSYITPKVILPSYESDSININLTEEISGNEFYPFNKLLEYGFATMETSGVPVGLNENNNFVVCPNKNEECNIGDGTGTIEITSSVGNNLKLKRTFNVSYIKMSEFDIYSNIKNGDSYLEDNEKEQTSNSNIEIEEGNVVKIYIKDIQPTNADFQQFIFSIDNNELFEIVSSDNTTIELKAKKAGETNLNIISNDNSLLSDKIKITIKETFDIKSNKYEIDINNNINKVNDSLNIDTLKNAFEINTNVELKVYNNGNQLNTSDLIGTGAILKTYRNDELLKEYFVIVSGDLNGDGKILANDILSIKLHILNKSLLVDNLFTAGDINGDNKVNATDILYLKMYILGKSNSIWG